MRLLKFFFIIFFVFQLNLLKAEEKKLKNEITKN